MPAGRFRPVYNQSPARAPRPTAQPVVSQRTQQALGAAVLRRGTFQPFNPRQQTRLHADVAAQANRIQRIRQAKAIHAQALKLYQQGQRQQALALNQHARSLAGLPSNEELPGEGVLRALEQAYDVATIPRHYLHKYVTSKPWSGQSGEVPFGKTPWRPPRTPPLRRPR